MSSSLQTHTDTAIWPRLSLDCITLKWTTCHKNNRLFQRADDYLKARTAYKQLCLLQPPLWWKFSIEVFVTIWLSFQAFSHVNYLHNDRATCFALIRVWLSNVTLGGQTSCIRQGQLNLKKANAWYSYYFTPTWFRVDWIVLILYYGNAQMGQENTQQKMKRKKHFGIGRTVKQPFKKYFT